MPERLSRVLVVDDDATIRDALELALSDEGYEVEAAANGREALSVLAGWRPDLIVLDLTMPIMNGWEFCAEQRRAGYFDVPVLVLTARRGATTLSSVVGATATVHKPFNLTDLLEQVDHLTHR
jgi:CheY-like chemotaxis protein